MARDCDSIVVVVIAFLLIVLISVSQRFGACFLGAFEDKKVSKILICPNMLSIITLGYPAESTGKIERIDELTMPIYYER